MAAKQRTIVWISGATQGIGAALARAVPWEGARVINISRRVDPVYESVVADLTDPASWDVIAEHFANELAEFKGERAIFVHNAFYPGTRGFAAEVDPVEQRRQVLANAAAPLVLGDAFMRACRPGYESGLIMVSSAAAKHAMEGMAVYGAAKAGMEQWVRGVRAERLRRGTAPWVVAIRPGFVVSEQMLEQHRTRDTTNTADYPGGAAVAAAIDAGEYLTPDESARRIWEAMPPDPAGRTVLFFGKFVEGTSVDATRKTT
jgi:benzil reductase ((S)-benzoin forming)